MTAIPTTADLLRLLREDPDFRDEVRSLLLTQELIELPERFARFEAYVERQFSEIREDIAKNTSDISEMRGDISEMRGDISEMRGDISEMRGDISEMRGDIGRLKGGEYERKVSRSFTSYASRIFRLRNNRRLRRNRLLLGATREPTPDFEDTLAVAVENGQISDDELEELREADAVMMGLDQETAVYFVGEFSVTINHHDIDRAIDRAAILNRATGSDAWPMVVGDTIPEPQRAKIEAEGVAWRQIAE